MSQHAWSQKDTFELIRLYEINAPLWDTKHTDYRNKEVKIKIINNIASQMNVTAEEVNRKLHNLRNQVSQELHKLKKKKEHNNSNETLTSNWTYFSALKFLIPSVLNRSRNTDITIQQIMLQGKESNRRNTTLNEVENIEASEKKHEKREESHPVQSIDISSEEESRQLARILPKIPNEDDRFGEYVALELRSLRSEVSKRKLKSEIRKAICRIADLDDAGIFVTNTSSNPSSPYSPSSTTYVPVCEIYNVKSEDI